LVPNYLIILAAIDLTDLDMWARAVPYGEFGRLGREAPVAWSAGEGSGFWSVSRYADIVAASRDVATFSSSRGSPSRIRPTRTWPPGGGPDRVLAQVMGLPAPDLDLFIDLGDRLIANTDPEITDVAWGRDDTDPFGPCRERGEGALAPI
jgi:hypothetical protein